MTAPLTTPKRLLIGAGSFADAQSALRLAERLVEFLAADLGGLLVEDTIVSEIVGLPGQRVVTTRGALLLAPSRQQVRTLMESDAKAFRDALAGLAQARSRDWSFERAQGDLIARLCQNAKGWDLVLLGHRPIRRQAGDVILIAPPAEAAQAAVDVAEALARALKTDLTVLSLAQDGQEASQGAKRQARFTSEAAMLAHVSKTNASAVVLDLSAGPLHRLGQLRDVLAVARCPILVLGAAQGDLS